MKKLTIHDDSCQEAFLLVGVPVVGLALLVPEAGHPFGAGQVLTHRVLHAGPPAVLPTRPWAAVGTNQGQYQTSGMFYLPPPTLALPPASNTPEDGDTANTPSAHVLLAIKIPQKQL